MAPPLRSICRASVCHLLAMVAEATPVLSLSGGNGGALCGGTWADHPEPVQELSQEERGQQRLCGRPQGQDGAAPSLQAVHCPTTQDALAGAYLALLLGSPQTLKWRQNLTL